MDYFLVLSLETYPFVFSFCLTFCMKLSEAVTYAGHEGMSIWGTSPVQSVCALCFGGELSLCAVAITVLLEVDSGRLHPGLGLGWGVRSCSCTSQVVLVLKNPPANVTDKRHGWFHSLGQEDPLEKVMATHSSILAWRIPWTAKPMGYSPWDHRVEHNWSDTACTHMCTLVRGWAGVWTVGATPLGLSHSPSPSVHRGCTPQEWRSLSYSFPLSLQRVCTMTDALAVTISIRELVLLPLEYMHPSVYWQWLLPPQSEVGPGPSWLCSLEVCTPSLAMAAPALVARSTGARGARIGAQCGSGDTGLTLVSQQEQQAAFNPLPLCCDWK